jgi:uncharacterized RDD family membrane protein YckC
MNEGTMTPQADAVENVTGRRIVAGIIDFLLMTALFLLMAGLFGDLGSSSDSDSGSSFSANLDGVPALIYFVLLMSYYTVLEATSGQTLGKMLLGIKVVSKTGELGFGKAIIRSLCRLIDAFPWFIPYLLALILVLATKQHQRIGDMAAGTIVVRARQPATSPEARF